MTRAAAYVRISRDRTGLRAGVERQREDTAALAARRGWDLVEVLEDNDVSASSGRVRPAYQRLLRGLDAGEWDAVVTWHPDRLYRRPADLEALIDLLDGSRVEVATCTAGDVDLSTPTGRMTARIIGAVARAEVERISERVRSAFTQQARAGRAAAGGRRGYGYEWDTEAHAPRIVEAEAEVLRRVTREVVRGRTLGAVVAELNRDGVLTPTGARWRAPTLRRQLLSPRLSGRRSHRVGGVRGVGGVVIVGEPSGEWEAILSVREQERLRAVLGDRAPISAGPRATRTRRLLTGLLVCECGGHLNYTSGRRYACSRRGGGCGRITLLAGPAEALVFGAAQAEYDRRLLWEEDEAGPAAKPDTDADAIAEALVDERLALEARRDETDREVARGTLTSRSAGIRLGEIDALLADVADRLGRVGSGTATWPGGLGAALAAAQHWALPAAELDEAQILERRAFIGAVVERVEVSAGQRGVFSPDRLRIVWR
jgi:DNA invertase Pin-like site-specific DNA recombinase